MLNNAEIKRFVHEREVKLGRDVLSTLEDRLVQLLVEGVDRAKQNNRKTLLGRDL